MKLKLSFLFILFLSLAACASVQTTKSPLFHSKAKWAVAQFNNNTETPLAGAKSESITTAVLQNKGITNLVAYQSETKSSLPGINKQLSKKQILSWARKQGATYVVMGAVNEWRYKLGVDGKPVVNL